MKYRLNVYSIWEFGQRKDAQGNPHQEDSIFPKYGQERDGDRLFVLCDGMGGHDAGEVASQTVCEAMSRSVAEHVPDPEGHFGKEDLERAVADAFDALDRKDTGAAKKMGTTMTFLKLHDRGATIAHMGDSRVYHLRPGKGGVNEVRLHVTRDHSLVNDLIRIGELTEEEAKHSRQKNVITRAMQPNMERRPRAEVHETADIQAGDYFYMCSDGMLEEMTDEEICAIFSEAGKPDIYKRADLVEKTKDNRDNHTAIIVHVLEVIDDGVTAREDTVTGMPDHDTPVEVQVVDAGKGPGGAGNSAEPVTRIPAAAEADTPVKREPRDYRDPDTDDDGETAGRKRTRGGLSLWWIISRMMMLMGVLACAYLFYLYTCYQKQGGGNSGREDSSIQLPNSSGGQSGCGHGSRPATPAKPVGQQTSGTSVNSAANAPQPEAQTQNTEVLEGGTSTPQPDGISNNSTSSGGESPAGTPASVSPTISVISGGNSQGSQGSGSSGSEEVTNSDGQNFQNIVSGGNRKGE